MVQTAEGALEETGAILSRMRELVVESSSRSSRPPSVPTCRRVQCPQNEIELTADSTEFALNLSDGTTTSVDVQVGIFNLATTASRSASGQPDGHPGADTGRSPSVRPQLRSRPSPPSTRPLTQSITPAIYGAVQNQLTSPCGTWRTGDLTEGVMNSRCRLRGRWQP